jgi:hypothetical protein
MKLFKGHCRIVGRKSRFALDEHGLASSAAGDTVDRTTATP